MWGLPNFVETAHSHMAMRRVCWVLDFLLEGLEVFFLLLDEATHPGLGLTVLLPGRKGISSLLEVGVTRAKAFEQQLVLRVDAKAWVGL